MYWILRANLVQNLVKMVIVNIKLNILNTAIILFSLFLELTWLKQNAKIKKGRGFLTNSSKRSGLNKKYVFEKLEQPRDSYEVKPNKLDSVPQKCI